MKTTKERIKGKRKNGLTITCNKNISSSARESKMYARGIRIKLVQEFNHLVSLATDNGKFDVGIRQPTDGFVLVKNLLVIFQNPHEPILSLPILSCIGCI